MLDRKAVIEKIKECLQLPDRTELCALFLVFVKAWEGNVEEPENSEWVAGVFTHFFRKTDIVGYLGYGCYAVFLTGKITGNVVYEKTAGLTQALRLGAWENLGEEAEVPVGVYLASPEERCYADLFKMAEYALEMAGQDTKRFFYVYTSPGIREKFPEIPETLAAGHTMFHYIDEGVRIMEGGDVPQTVYVSPGFYQRLSLDEENASGAVIRIHPDDMEIYEKQVREVSRTGKPANISYRVSADGKNWISCRVRLLRIMPEGREQNPLVIEISHNIAGLEQLKEKLDEKISWLGFVAEQTDYQLWEVDIQTRVFRMLYTGDNLPDRSDTYENFPESLIESGRVHSGSAEDFRTFAGELLSGRLQGNGNFMVQYRPTSCYGWAAMSYRMLCDRDGKPVKAMGIKEELSYIPCQQSRFVQRRIMPADLYSSLYCYLQANLTADSVEKLLLEGRERIRMLRGRTYGEVIEEESRRLFSEEDAKRILTEFSRERLLKQFEEGRCWFYNRFRIVDTDGSIRWIASGVNLGRDSESGEVCLYTYMNRMDSRMKWEKEWKDSTGTDSETGIYQYESWKNLVRHLLEESGGHTGTLAQISIEGAGELFPEDTVSSGEKDIITALHVFLNTDCLVGWKDRHTVLVFFPGCDSPHQIRRRLENAFSFVRISLSGMYGMRFLRFIAGAVSRGEDELLGELLYLAAGICALHAGEASDTVEVCSARDACQWESIPLKKQMDREAPQAVESSGILTEKEKDMALECLGLMLETENTGELLKGILQKLGEYYRADRVYILALTEEKRVMTMLHEWAGPGKYSIQQTVSGKRTSSFPMITNYIQHPEKMVFTRGEEKNPGWKFAIFPMESGKDSEKLLCIENPREPLEQSALIDRILPYLEKERVHFRERQKQNSSLDRFFSLPNMEECMKVLYSVDSDEYSSLGVMIADVPEYGRLKEKKGFEYGRRILIHIFETLEQVFDRPLLFHTKEEEFLVLCTDVACRTFLELCARVKQIIGTECRGLIRTGWSWADGVFTARGLVKKAHSIMECDTPGEITEIRPLSAGSQGRSIEEEIMARFQTEGKPAVYLQPKIDMRDGRLMGAEALFRVIDKNGGLLPHGLLIETMEKEGTIQKVDYFVFDQVLKTINSWQKKGFSLVPVSSNFSRNTLLSPSSLASVLAVASRYPLVSPELVELEITETAGDFENNTFAELIRRFGEYGFQFSLDDFGFGYSSMNMLAELEFRSVKLDRSLIKNITENATAGMIVHDLVRICDSCGMICIAEGVESQAQADVLLENGCIYGQGFYYDRPVSLETFEEKYLQPEKKEAHN